MNPITTFLFYSFVFIVLFILARYGERKGRNTFIKAAYIGLFLLTVLRYDTGNDYANYFRTIEYVSFLISNDNSFFSSWEFYMSLASQEPAFLVFIYLFHSLPCPPLWIIFIYSAIAIFFLYKAMDEYKCHSIGLLLFFVSGLMFWYFDLIRQSAAMSLFFYSLKYIRDGKPLKYAIIILSAMLFHLSVFFCLPYYFIRYLKVPKLVYVFMILIVVMMMFANINMDGIFNYVGDLPFYEQYSNDKRLGSHFEGFGYKLRLLCYALISILTILRLAKKDDYLAGILAIGTSLFIISQGNLLLDRFSIYLFYVVVIAFAIVISNSKDIIRMLCVIFVGLLFFLTSKNIMDGSDRGCSPYKTVFSEDFARGRFKLKNY